MRQIGNPAASPPQTAKQAASIHLQAVATATSPHELQTSWVRLADNFGRLFHAPEDVAAFKGLILDLAVSGALLTTEIRHASTGADLIDAIADARIEWSKVAIDQEKKKR